MSAFVSILFWVGVVLLADGSLGLIFEDRWQKLARGVNVRRLAFIEIGFAMSLLILHFLLRNPL